MLSTNRVLRSNDDRGDVWYGGCVWGGLGQIEEVRMKLKKAQRDEAGAKQEAKLLASQIQQIAKGKVGGALHGSESGDSGCWDFSPLLSLFSFCSFCLAYFCSF